jgi:hypothetical protein
MFKFLPIDSGYTVTDFGAFGRQPFGNPASTTESESLWDIIGRTYPHSPLKFTCESGQEGPQTVMTWEPPTKLVARVMIRRKQKEYPRDPSDGILVLDDAATPNTRTSYVDSTLSRVLWSAQLGAASNAVGTVVAASSLNALPDVLEPLRAQAGAAALAEINSQFGTSVTLAEVVASGDVTMKGIAKILKGGDLTATETPGDCSWWYYRLFVLPNQREVRDQFGGLGLQSLRREDEPPLTATLTTAVMDVQEFKDVEVTVVNRGELAATFTIYGGPDAANGVVLSTIVVATLGDGRDANLKYYTLSDQSHKYLWVSMQGGDAASNVDGEVLFTAARSVHWQSSAYLSKPSLAYVTGRHLDLIWRDGLLPEVYLAADRDIEPEHKRSLVTALTTGGWINSGESELEQGPLYRFLKLLTLELDRDHAYYQAMIKYDHDIDHAPEQVLKHIAFELGWEVDTSAHLRDVREELFRVAGLYKNKTTPDLIESIVSQTLNILPRVQEGGGLVLRTADPSLFPQGSS